jgi:hypothetical protein
VFAAAICALPGLRSSSARSAGLRSSRCGPSSLSLSWYRAHIPDRCCYINGHSAYIAVTIRYKSSKRLRSASAQAGQNSAGGQNSGRSELRPVRTPAGQNSGRSELRPAACHQPASPSAPRWIRTTPPHGARLPQDAARRRKRPVSPLRALFGLFENGVGAEDDLHQGGRRPDSDDESTVIHAITCPSVLSCSAKRAGRLAGPAQAPHRSHRSRQHPQFRPAAPPWRPRVPMWSLTALAPPQFPNNSYASVCRQDQWSGPGDGREM